MPVVGAVHRIKSRLPPLLNSAAMWHIAMPVAGTVYSIKTGPSDAAFSRPRARFATARRVAGEKVLPYMLMLCSDNNCASW